MNKLGKKAFFVNKDIADSPNNDRIRSFLAKLWLVDNTNQQIFQENRDPINWTVSNFVQKPSEVDKGSFLENILITTTQERIDLDISLALLQEQDNREYQDYYFTYKKPFDTKEIKQMELDTKSVFTNDAKYEYNFLNENFEKFNIHEAKFANFYEFLDKYQKAQSNTLAIGRRTISRKDLKQYFDNLPNR